MAATNPPHVLKALADVRAAINQMGIEKDREVTEGVQFKFRGIDDVMDAFSAPMVAADLMIIPSYSAPVVTERPTKYGKTYNTVICGNYTAISTRDGSQLPLGSFFGEANDTQDKSMAKAQSIALRQAYLQTFVVPLGPEMDPETYTQPDQQDAPQAPPPMSKAAKEKAQAAPGPGNAELTQGQRRILENKMAPKGIDFDDVPAEIMAGGFNVIQKWVMAL